MNELDKILSSTNEEDDNQRIICNAIETPDGTLLLSKHVHDCVTYIDKNGHKYMVDGGNEYLRRNLVEEAPFKELSIYDDGKHETRRKYIRWGVRYNKDMTPLSETKWTLIKDLSTEHIEAIIDGKYANGSMYLLLQEELKYRNK